MQLNRLEKKTGYSRKNEKTFDLNNRIKKKSINNVDIPNTENETSKSIIKYQKLQTSEKDKCVTSEELLDKPNIKQI